jgi:hypothetical protein
VASELIATIDNAFAMGKSFPMMQAVSNLMEVLALHFCHSR